MNLPPGCEFRDIGEDERDWDAEEIAALNEADDRYEVARDNAEFDKGDSYDR